MVALIFLLHNSLVLIATFQLRKQEPAHIPISIPTYMQNRNMSNFSAWLEQQKEAELRSENPDAYAVEDESSSLLGRLSAIGDSFTVQLEELNGSLPGAGPMSAEFRGRMVNAIYLLLASAGFCVLAVIIGVPTLLVRPAKFVVCTSLASLCAAGSVIVMQKPSVFFQGLLAGEPAKTIPTVALLVSLVTTLYVAIFIHKYMYILVFGAIQMLCLFYYLASFIPGGTKGLSVLLNTGYMFAKTAMQPCIFVTKKAVVACISRYTS